MATPTNRMAILSLFFFVVSSAIVSAQSKVQTFTYVNQGEFGPYITEYGADYRTLPIYSSPFQMAFYNTTPGAFFLALRMATRRSESLFRWVWEANRGRPVRDNATFSLRSDGDLVLADPDGSVVWSTNTANKGVIGLRILPTGNVVLYGDRDRLIWQSFDHPTDTLFIGQSLRIKGPRKLVSHSSAVDGSSGAYSLVLESGGLTMYLDAPKPLPYYNYSDGVFSFSPTVTSVKFECNPETEDAFAYELTLTPMSGSTSDGTRILGRPKYNATLSILRLDIDGNLRVYTYYNPVDYRPWETTFALFSDDPGWLSGCRLPSKCGGIGGLGVCEDEMCVACPTEKGLLGWSKECLPPAADCGGGRRRGGAKYYKVVGVENYLSSYSKGEGVVGLGECRKRCSSDCSCVGFLFWEGESKCWLAPLLGTLPKVSNSSHVAYIKA